MPRVRVDRRWRPQQVGAQPQPHASEQTIILNGKLKELLSLFPGASRALLPKSDRLRRRKIEAIHSLNLRPMSVDNECSEYLVPTDYGL